MIINLKLEGKTIVVIGGGNEAQKRINSLLRQDCKIMVISDSINPQISRWARSKKIILEKKKIQDTKFISELKPDIIITTTSDKRINQKILDNAKKRKIIAYSSDNPDDSDYANPAIIDFENMIQIAIFTGGRSPIISKKIKVESEKIFKKIITRQEISEIKIQETARRLAKKTLAKQSQRRDYLHMVMLDSKINQLIKDGQIKRAEKRAIMMLKDWK